MWPTARLAYSIHKNNSRYIILTIIPLQVSNIIGVQLLMVNWFIVVEIQEMNAEDTFQIYRI